MEPNKLTKFETQEINTKLGTENGMYDNIFWTYMKFREEIISNWIFLLTFEKKKLN